MLDGIKNLSYSTYEGVKLAGQKSAHMGKNTVSVIQSGAKNAAEKIGKYTPDALSFIAADLFATFGISTILSHFTCSKYFDQNYMWQSTELQAREIALFGYSPAEGIEDKYNTCCNKTLISTGIAVTALMIFMAARNRNKIVQDQTLPN
jgi:hypothetical protein